MKIKLLKVLLLSLSFSVIAAEADTDTDPFPESFELVCDRVFVIGREKRNISSSYLSWNRETKSVLIKSEMLDEYESSLSPLKYDVFSARKDLEEDEVIELTFKERSPSNIWEDQKSIQVVAIEITRGLDASNAFLKVSDFYIKYGVIQKVNTRHAACNVRNFEPSERPTT